MKITLEISDNEVKVVCENGQTVGIILADQPQQYTIGTTESGEAILSDPEVSQDHVKVIEAIKNSAAVKFAQAIHDNPNTGFNDFLQTL